MRVLQDLRQQWRRHLSAQEAEVADLKVAYAESERLRIELSHLEHEIYRLWESDLPRRQKLLLEQAIRVRVRQVEDEMLKRQYRILASGRVLLHW